MTSFTVVTSLVCVTIAFICTGCDYHNFNVNDVTLMSSYSSLLSAVPGRSGCTGISVISRGKSVCGSCTCICCICCWLYWEQCCVLKGLSSRGGCRGDRIAVSETGRTMRSPIRRSMGTGPVGDDSEDSV